MKIYVLAAVMVGACAAVGCGDVSTLTAPSFTVKSLCGRPVGEVKPNPVTGIVMCPAAVKP